MQVGSSINRVRAVADREEDDFDDWGRMEREREELPAAAAGAEQGGLHNNNNNNNNNMINEQERLQAAASSAPALANPRMQITEQERQHALAIKAAIEEDAELENLSDFQYVQAAMIDEDNLQAALQRARHMQAFREEYKLSDDIDEATASLGRFLRQHAGVVLSIAYNNDDGNYVMIFDQTAFDQKSLNNPEAWRVHLVSMFFILHSLNPDFFAIRRGIVFVVECEGYDWKNCDLHTIERTWVEVLGMYPAIFRQIKYFHTGIFANLTASLMKRFLPASIHTKIQLGCRFEGRLDTFYLVPTMEAANDRVLERMQICLRRRYENERSFRL